MRVYLSPLISTPELTTKLSVCDGQPHSEKSEEERDLGIVIAHDLKVSAHCYDQLGNHMPIENYTCSAV